MNGRMRKNMMICCLIFISAWLAWTVNFWFVQSSALDKSTKRQIRSEVKERNYQVDDYLFRQKEDLRFLALLPEVQKALRTHRMSRALEAKLDHYREASRYTDFLMVDKEGKVMWSAMDKNLLGTDLNLPPNSSGLSDIYKPVKSSPESKLIVSQKQKNDFSVFLSVPVKNLSGEMINDQMGVMIVRLDKESLAQNLNLDSELESQLLISQIEAKKYAADSNVPSDFSRGKELDYPPAIFPRTIADGFIILGGLILIALIFILIDKLCIVGPQKKKIKLPFDKSVPIWCQI